MLLKKRFTPNFFEINYMCMNLILRSFFNLKIVLFISGCNGYYEYYWKIKKEINGNTRRKVCKCSRFNFMLLKKKKKNFAILTIFYSNILPAIFSLFLYFPCRLSLFVKTLSLNIQKIAWKNYGRKLFVKLNVKFISIFKILLHICGEILPHNTKKFGGIFSNTFFFLWCVNSNTFERGSFYSRPRILKKSDKRYLIELSHVRREGRKKKKKKKKERKICFGF